MSLEPHSCPVLVTGVGLHTAFGDGEATLEAWRAGRSAVAMRPVLGLPELPVAIAPAPAPAELLGDRKLLKYMSPTTALSVVGAGRALRSAGLGEDAPAREAMALFIGTGLTAFDLAEVGPAVEAARDAQGELDPRRVGAGLARCHPLMPFKTLLNMPVGLTSIAFGLRGENFITYPGAYQAGHCFETAVRGLRTGRFERALVGASVQGVSLMPLSTLWRAGWLSDSCEAARPFAAGRRGVAPTDVSAFVVLESESAAAARGARPLAILDPPAGLGPAPDEHRAPERRRLWQEACANGLPARVLLSGGVAARDDEEALALAAEFGAPRVEGLDGALGYLDAAGVAAGVGLAALLLGREAGPALVSVSDPRGGEWAALVRSPRGTP